MNNNHLINIAIHHIKEENEAHGIGELKRGLYRDLEGIHLDVNTIKTDIITVGSGITNLSDSLGDLAWDDKVEKAKLGTTIIEGGYLLTSLIKTDDLIVGDNIMMGPNAVIDWEHLAPEVKEEFDVGKMKWLGELNDFPIDPGVNHAFYHSINMCSYIWSGSEWYKISQDGTVGPKGEQGIHGVQGIQGIKGDTGIQGAKGDKGDKGDRGTDGSYYAPSYLKSTYIGATEIRSPLITGNTGRFTDSIYIGQNDGSNNKAGISALGTLDTSVRIWAGGTDKLTAPFRVTQGGSVYMTKANIETESVDNRYITMSGSMIDGGTDNGKSYVIGTGDYTGASRAGVFQSFGYSSSTSSTISRSMSVGNNSILITGANLVLGGKGEDRPTIITRRTQISHSTQVISDTIALFVNGGMEVSNNIVTRDIFVKGRIYIGDFLQFGVTDTFTTANGKTAYFTNGILTNLV